MTSSSRAPWTTAWSGFGAYVRPYRSTLASALVLLVFSAGMELLKPWPLKFIIDEVLRQGAGGGAGLRLHLLLACVAVVAIAVIGGLAEYHAQVRVARVGHTTASAIRGDLFQHLQQLSVGFHRTTGSGEMLTRLLKDVQELKGILGDVALETLTQTLLLSGMAVVLLWMDPVLGVVSMAVFGPVALCVRHYARHIKDVTRRQRRKDSKAASIMTEAIAMLPAVQLLGQGQHASRQFGRAAGKSLEAEVAAARMKGQLERWVEVLVAVGTGAVLWLGATAVLDGRLTPGDLVVFASYLKSTYRPTRRIATNWLQMSRATIGAERVLEVLRMEPAVKDLPQAIPAPPLEGAVAFDHVSYSYGDGRATLIV